MDAHLAKPIERNALLAALASVTAPRAETAPGEPGARPAPRSRRLAALPLLARGVSAMIVVPGLDRRASLALAGEFLEEIKAAAALLEQVPGHAGPALAQPAHRLAGAAATLGAERLAWAARRLQSAAAAKKADDDARPRGDAPRGARHGGGNRRGAAGRPGRTRPGVIGKRRRQPAAAAAAGWRRGWRQRRVQRGAQRVELALVLHLQPEHVLHVEDVHRPHAVGGDVGGGDLQPLLADRRGDVVQQARPVAAVHLDHGVGVGGVVVEHHARRHRHRPQPRRLPPHLADLVLQAQPAGQRLLDQHREPRQAVRLRRTRRRPRPAPRRCRAPCRWSGCGCAHRRWRRRPPRARPRCG